MHQLSNNLRTSNKNVKANIQCYRILIEYVIFRMCVLFGFMNFSETQPTSTKTCKATML